MCHTLIEGIHCKEHNSLICLTGDDSLKNDNIAAFMSTKRTVITVNIYVTARLDAQEGGYIGS